MGKFSECVQLSWLDVSLLVGCDILLFSSCS